MAPVVGAAMNVADLESLAPWILERDRDLELQDFIGWDVLDGDWAERVDRALALLGGHGGRIGTHGPFWNLPLDASDPAIVAVVQKRMAQGLEVCARLNGTHFVVHSPYSTWDHNNLENYPNARTVKIARTCDVMGPTVERAAELGVTVVIENIEDKDPMDRLALADAFGSDAVQLSVDTGHAHYAHGATGAPPVDYYIRRAGARLGHIHLQDADGHADRHWQLGHGTILWESVFEAIAEIDAAPRLIIELRDKAGVIPSANYLAARGLAV